MKRLFGMRGWTALIISIVGLIALAGGSSSAAVFNRPATRTVSAASSTPATRTFSYIASPNSKTVNVVNIDTLTMNARCDSHGSPVIFAFTSASNADLFGRVFDGFGRGHIIRNSAFTKTSRGVSLAPNIAGDYNSSGTIMFENSSGKVVTVNFGYDNATTLARLNRCTVYGSVIAT